MIRCFCSYLSMRYTPVEPDNEGAAHQGRATLLRMSASLDSAMTEILDSLMRQPWGKETVIVFASVLGGSSPKPWLIEMLIPPCMRDVATAAMALSSKARVVFSKRAAFPACAAAIWWRR